MKKEPYPRRGGQRRPRQQPSPQERPPWEPRADSSLAKIFRRIGRPENVTFVPDAFQLEALEAVSQSDCLVSAPTGAGKTWIATQAIAAVLAAGGRSWYASPLKALSNAKWTDFTALFGADQVGIVTGDRKENPDAPIIVGTTEILRNQLYDSMSRGENLNCDLVVLDEAHYLGDHDRGVVWEEIMIYLPARVKLLLLSATIGNDEEIAAWLEEIRGEKCRVIRETKRPTPLYNLFLHPQQGLCPLLANRQLTEPAQSHLARRTRGRPQVVTNRQILDTLHKFQLEPAIFFLKSRAECNAALLNQEADATRDEDSFLRDLEEVLEKFPYLREHRQLFFLINHRLAAHHGGQLPAWKFLVETMMKKGHLRAIFATSTVAAGVNFPARTIVLFNSDIYNGHDFSPLSATEFHQMAGRAGRRGQDYIGFMLAVTGRFMDLEHLKKTILRRPEDIKSQIRVDFSMVLNLLLSQTPESIRHILMKSLAAFQKTPKQGPGKKNSGFADLWEQFERHLAFLKGEGFVDEKDRLTANGRWAAKLRLDQPLLIAESIRAEAFDGNDEALLAALVSLFVYDGDSEIKIDKRRRPRRLASAFSKLNRVIEPLGERMKAAGFAVTPLRYWVSQAILDWAKGSAWEKVLSRYELADGDLAMLITRTADNLRQLTSLAESHPELALLARRGRETILREPVVYI
jgi:superfamily II RNA helicase